jgi:two-component system, cell cycle sensor histidine kinase and response regulator CckA
MITDSFNQYQLKSLPSRTERKSRQGESNLNEAMQSMQRFLLQYVNGNIETQVILANQELPVMIDRVQIEEALVHLIMNAREAMPTGGRLTIKTGLAKLHSSFIGGRNDGGLYACALVSVSDTGKGMDEQTLSKLFEPFHTTKDGTYRGLGLPMVFNIIKRHNGSINVETRLGYGTTVKIYLPLVRKTPANEEAIPLPPAGAYTSLSHREG